jgi:AcrR family transcriptional regulator
VRESLLAAGLDLIGTKGYKAATVKAICSGADLSESQYREAFDGIEDILIELYHKQLMRMESVLIQAALSPGDLARKPAQVLTGLLDLLESDPRIGRIVFFEMMGVSARVEKTYRTGLEKFTNIIAMALTPFILRFGKPVDAELTARAVVGAVIHVLAQWQYSGFKPDKKRLVSNLAAVMEIAGQKL